MDQLNTTTFTPDRERGQHLKFEDRCCIKVFHKLNQSLRKIAGVIGCSPSTVMYKPVRDTGERQSNRGSFPEYSAKKGRANYEINRSKCHKNFRKRFSVCYDGRRGTQASFFPRWLSSVGGAGFIFWCISVLLFNQ